MVEFALINHYLTMRGTPKNADIIIKVEVGCNNAYIKDQS